MSHALHILQSLAIPLAAWAVGVILLVVIRGARRGNDRRRRY